MAHDSAIVQEAVDEMDEIIAPVLPESDPVHARLAIAERGFSGKKRDFAERLATRLLDKYGDKISAEMAAEKAIEKAEEKLD